MGAYILSTPSSARLFCVTFTPFPPSPPPTHTDTHTGKDIHTLRRLALLHPKLIALATKSSVRSWRGGEGYMWGQGRAAWGAGPHGADRMGNGAIEEGERPHGLVKEGRGRPKGLSQKEDGDRVGHFGGHNSSSRARRRGRQDKGGRQEKKEAREGGG